MNMKIEIFSLRFNPTLYPLMHHMRLPTDDVRQNPFALLLLCIESAVPLLWLYIKSVFFVLHYAYIIIIIKYIQSYLCDLNPDFNLEMKDIDNNSITIDIHTGLKEANLN